MEATWVLTLASGIPRVAIRIGPDRAMAQFAWSHFRVSLDWAFSLPSIYSMPPYVSF